MADASRKVGLFLRLLAAWKGWYAYALLSPRAAGKLQLSDPAWVVVSKVKGELLQDKEELKRI